MKGKTISNSIVCFVLIGFFSAINAFAADYPTKPVNLYIPYSGGGSTDIAARMLANLAQQNFATPLVTINKPGGGSALMHGLIAKAKPDGYTLGILMTAALTRIPHLRDVNYDPMNDFTPIMQFAVYQHGLAVKSDSPFQTFEEFIAFAKANPGKVTFSTAGAASGQHLVMEYLAIKEGIQWIHIPYKGGVPAVTACLGGHVTAVAQSPEWAPYVKSGDMRLLAVFSENRISAFPDVRTLREIGYDYALISGMGIVGPKGLPEEIVKKIEVTFSEAAQQKGFEKLLKRLNLLRVERNREDLTKMLAEEYQQKEVLIKKLGLYKK